MTEELKAAIRKTYYHLKSNGVPIPIDVALKARTLGVFKAGGGGLPSVKRVYNDAIVASLIVYFEGGSIGTARNAFKNAMLQSFGDAYDLGWTNGGQELPVDADAMAWMEARMNQEAGYIDGVLVQAKELRKDKQADFFAWITKIAAAYVLTLGTIYLVGSLFAQADEMMTWQLGSTEQHCDTCLKLDGTTHKASWYIAHDYIPGKGGAAMDCKGYNCDCSLNSVQDNTKG